MVIGFGLFIGILGSPLPLSHLSTLRALDQAARYQLDLIRS